MQIEDGGIFHIMGVCFDRSPVMLEVATPHKGIKSIF